MCIYYLVVNILFYCILNYVIFFNLMIFLIKKVDCLMVLICFCLNNLFIIEKIINLEVKR